MPLDPNLAGLLSMIKASGAPAFSESTVAGARAAARLMTVDYRDPATVPSVGSVQDSVASGVPVRIYRPATPGPHPTVVFFHGGGFVIGDLDTHDSSCRRLCNDVDAVVVAVDYRLAPEHRFPAAVDDCFVALGHVAAHVDEFGGDENRVAVAGDSAGGNLATVCCLLARSAGPRLRAQLLIYPAVDFGGEYASRVENAEGYLLSTADMQWFGRHYLDSAAAGGAAVAAAVLDPRASPLNAPSLDGLPPAVVITAEYDPLRDEGNAYAQALEQAGVAVTARQFPGLTHGFYGLELISPAIADATSWIHAQLRALLA
jgi:acetyl esterase